MADAKPIIAVTMGDPAGVGPEICVKALGRREQYKILRPFVVGERTVIERAMRFCGLKMKIKTVSVPSEGSFRPGTINLVDMRNINTEEYMMGKVNALCGKASFDYIERAAKLALAREADAVVTAPINKEALNKAHIDCSGHTEILGEITGVQDPLTMFEIKGLRVFFLTRHMSLQKAIQAVTEGRVFDYIMRCTSALRSLDIANPLLAVAGLNPHSGEGGLFGDEEARCIAPALERARKQGVQVEGPVPADSVFALALRGRYSAVLSLYHDQGHIAAKTLDFERTISITLGLPFLRTSPDHGTAFDIAGTGTAREHSMRTALLAASRYSGKYRQSMEKDIADDDGIR
jgi:4-hydroxythreonine-4-phosphate dehydrogenase